MVVLLGAVAIWLPASSSGRTLTPRQGHSFLVSKVGGTVVVTTPGGKSVALAGARLVPFGSTVDASQGSARVTVAAAGGKTYSGRFSEGTFKPAQSASGSSTTEIKVGGDLCQRASIARHRPHLHRYLRAQAPPDFVVVGSSGSAQATSGVAKFTLADACAGATVAAGSPNGNATAVSDHSGSVEADSTNGRIRTTIEPGGVEQLRCAHTAGYCLGVRLETRGDLRGSYFPVVATARSTNTFELCLTVPSGQRSCQPAVANSPVFEHGRGFTGSVSTVLCQAHRTGSYAIIWRLNGVQLGPPLSFHMPVVGRAGVPCLGFLGNLDDNPQQLPLPANLKVATRLVIPFGLSVGIIGVKLGPNGGAQGQEVVRGVIYANQGSAPGALLAVTQPIVFKAGMPLNNYTMTFPGGRSYGLQPGTYWIGVISGGNDRVATIGADPYLNSGVENADSYSSGPSNPFGPSVVENAYLSVNALSVVGTG